MSTTENFNVYKGLPYAVKARADGKWDYTGNQTFTTEGQTLSVTMSNYDGLSSSYEESFQSADKLDFSNTLLPWKWEYNNTLDVSKYCLMPVGTNYENIIDADYIYNFDVVGSPTINNQTKIVSGFSTSDYLKMKSYPTSFSSFEIVFKIKTPASFPNRHMSILAQETTNYITPQLEISNVGKVWCGVTTSGVSPWISIAGTTVLTTNTWYFVKFTWNGSSLDLLMSTDGSTWTSEGTASCNSVYWGEASLIGRDNDTASAFEGSIDLSQSYIKINGSNWWVPEFTKTAINDNFIISGNPTISSNAVVSNFSTSNCLYIAYENFPLTKGTTLFVKFTTGSNVSSINWQYISKKSGFLTLHIASGHLGTFNYQQGSESVVTSVSANTTYYVKIEFLSESKKFYVSTDGTNWTSYTINDNSYNDVGGYTYFGRDHSAVDPFNGSIDLKYLYLTNTSTGQEIWNALTNAKETLAGCTYNFTDDGSATTLNAFVVNGDESIVLTPDNSYTNGWKLGTVNIPSHTAYDYNNGVWTAVS